MADDVTVEHADAHALGVEVRVVDERIADDRDALLIDAERILETQQEAVEFALL
jgi:hypothetical protein